MIRKTSRMRFWMYVGGPALVGMVAGLPRVDLNISQESVPFVDIVSLFDINMAQGFLLLGLLLYRTLPANLLVYGINDIFDYQTDKRNQKKTSYEQLLLPTEHQRLWKRIVILNSVMIIPLFVARWYIQPSTLGFGVSAWVVFILLSWQYSAPPLRAKSIPFVDGITNLLYIMPGVVTYAAAGGTRSTLSLQAIIAARLRAMAMHAYSAIPDIQPDTEAGVDTTATCLGRRGTLIYCGVLYLLAGVLMYDIWSYISLLLAAVYVSMILVSLLYKNIFGLYRMFPLINTIVGFAIRCLVVGMRLI